MRTALYRRYRPETFDEVVGQEHVTVPLMAALEGDRTNHAYLFSGPRGCGKTTSARILARCLNCAEGPTATPCGECESCGELSRDGTGSLDVVEMDAASHGGVDDARELRERASFAPLRDRFKVFIIDEAHMVSNQGFNALLKLVEEPPPHVKFIFATTEPDKVIGTIRSRTHHYPFRLVPPGILQDYLADLANQENVDVADGVLTLVVRAGTGSVRDSLSVLDQLIGGAASNSLDYETTVSLLGYTDGALLDSAVDAIAAIDGAGLFAAVANVVESGHDPRRFTEDLLERLRDLVVIALVGEDAKDVLSAVPEDQFDRMVDQAERMTAQRASRCADLANSALSDMAGATSPRLQLELLSARLLLAANTPTSGGSGPATGLADARAAALSYKQPAKADAPQAEEPAPGTSGRVVPAPARVADSAGHTPDRVGADVEPVSGPAAKQQPGRLVPPAPEQETDTRASRHAPQKPSAQAPVSPGTKVEFGAEDSQVAPHEQQVSDEETLNTLRGMWRAAMADDRVPPGTSDFIRRYDGTVSVVDGVLRFDFPSRDSADTFISEKRSTSLETVFGEMLKKVLNVDVGVIGATAQAGRESSDDEEGDPRPEVANPADSPAREGAQSLQSATSPGSQAPAAEAPGQSPTATTRVATATDTAGPARTGRIDVPPGGEDRVSAQSPAFAGGSPTDTDATVSNGVSAAEWDEQAPPGEDDDALHTESRDPGTGPTSPHDGPDASLPRGLPTDLPDIVMDDFPAPPPAAVPSFPAPPPRHAPESGVSASSPSRPNAFARLAQNRGIVELEPEEALDVEREHELVSRDDPLALEARGVGLDVVLEVMNGKIVEEVVEES